MNDNPLAVKQITCYVSIQPTNNTQCSTEARDANVIAVECIFVYHIRKKMISMMPSTGSSVALSAPEYVLVTPMIAWLLLLSAQ